MSLNTNTKSLARIDETEGERERERGIDEKVYLIGVVQSTIVAPVSGLLLHSTRKLAHTHETSTPIPIDIVPSAEVLENNEEVRPRSCWVTAWFDGGLSMTTR